jgi:hypothetical protein
MSAIKSRLHWLEDDKMKERKLFLHCPSVGSFVDTSNLKVYPELINGKPDFGMEVDYMDISSEWLQALDDQDSYNFDMIDCAGDGVDLEADEREYIEDAYVPAEFLVWESVVSLCEGTK